MKLVFDIKIMTKSSLIFYAYLLREYKIAAIMVSIRTTMSIEKAHIMTGHHDEEQTHRIALELVWPLKKELMMPCKACLIGKARQLAVNKHVDDSKKAPELVKEYFKI